MKFSFQELQEENRILNRTVKRQGLELERLLGAEGELPTILQAHNAEVRALKAKLKKVQQDCKDLALKVDRRDALLFKMRETNR